MNKRIVVSALAVLCLVMIGALIVTLKPEATPQQAEAAPGSPSAQGAGESQLTPEQKAELRLTLEQASQELNQGQYALAQRRLEDAATRFPRRQQVQTLLHEAHVGQQQWQPAYAAIQEAINIGPASAPMHDAAGVVANKAGFVEEAVQHYALAMSIDAANPKYPLYRAQLLLKLGEDDQARRFLMQTVNLDEAQDFAWGTLAQLALRENEPDLALQYITRAREIEPTRSHWIIEECKALRRKNEAERAAMLITGLPQDVRDQPGILEDLATSYAMLGQPGDAATAWQERSDRLPNDWYAAWQAAVWFERAGDYEEALRFAQIAAVVGPEQEQPREMLRRLTSAAAVPGDEG
jgi:tetratricopeptide (TPR) repeat protein